jgi:predicted branched-subunit amino acid permease
MSTNLASALAATPSRTSPSTFLAGARAIAPMVVGVVPFGIAIGSASATLHSGAAWTWAGSILLVAGTAQLTMMQLLHDGANAFVVLLAVAMVNARFVVYSAGLASWFPGASRRRRLLLAVPIVDQLYFTATTRYAEHDLDEDGRRSYFLGAATVFVLSWVAAQSCGLLIRNHLPESIGLDTMSLLALIGLVSKAIGERRALAAATTSAVVAVVVVHCSAQLAVLAAIVVGASCAAARRVAS